MTAEKFWTGWLKVTMILVMIAGSIMVALFFLGYLPKVEAEFERIYLNRGMSLEKIALLSRWMVVLAGAIAIIWGGSMLYIANHGFKARKKWAWRWLFFPVLFWYLIDNFFSLYYGIYIDMILNTILFFQLIAPLLFLRNQFFPSTKPTNT